MSVSSTTELFKLQSALKVLRSSTLNYANGQTPSKLVTACIVLHHKSLTKGSLSNKQQRRNYTGHSTNAYYLTEL